MPTYEFTFAVGDVTIVMDGEDEDDAMDKALDVSADYIGPAFNAATVWTRVLETDDAA